MDTHQFTFTHNGQMVSGKSFEHNNCSETIKASNLHDISISNSYIGGGTEDCIDVVRGKGVWIEGCTIHSSLKTRTHITIKGGVQCVLIRKCTLLGNTKYPWQISIGDYTIYESEKMLPPTRVTIQDVSRGDGRKPLVLVLNGEVLHDRSVRVIKVPDFIVKILFFLKGKFS